MSRYAALGFLCLVLCRLLPAQTALDSELIPATQFDTSEFPLWVRDLRRAEIVAFGSFPFTMFFATFAMDSLRFANHGGNFSYAPWPFKSAGAVEMSRHERTNTIIAAAAASLVISLVDYIIVRYKRAKAAEADPGPGQPIIIRRPWPAGTEAPGDAEEENPAGGEL
jgi:hypothetical protein